MDGPIVAGRSIVGVVVEARSIIADANGAVLHGWSVTGSSAPVAEVYCSVVRGGAIRAWKRHRQMTQRLLVPSGRVLFVIYDSRPESSTAGSVMEVESGREAYGLLIIPPMLWYGFAGIASGESIIVNSPDMVHDPDEIDRLGPCAEEIPYTWKIHSLPAGIHGVL
jgi:dTDP-4-dehydrorhamnose 3,5-epimerase